MVRDIVTKRVAASGLEALPCDSAAAARAVDAADIACALLDMDLGDGSGTDVALALRTSRPDLPIAFFTANSKGPIAAAKLFGPVFEKPSQLEDALQWIATHAV